MQEARQLRAQICASIAARARTERRLAQARIGGGGRVLFLHAWYGQTWVRVCRYVYIHVYTYTYILHTYSEGSIYCSFEDWCLEPESFTGQYMDLLGRYRYVYNIYIYMHIYIYVYYRVYAHMWSLWLFEALSPQAFALAVLRRPRRPARDAWSQSGAKCRGPKKHVNRV